MNTQFKVKFLNHLTSKKADKGFTLIELLVVVIIIGVLAAIALPNLLGQVAKGRQAEAKNNLGAINRAQQTYRLEEQSFGVISNLPVKFTWQYYDDPSGQGVNNAVFSSYSVAAKADFADDILNYAAGVYQSNGTFQSVICEESGLNGVAPAVAQANLATGACNAGKKVIK